MAPVDLTGHVALVTGASSGLGQRAARVLAGAGARVVGVARRADALEALAREADGAIAPLPVDLADRGALSDCAARAAEPFGAPDIVVHAAGINTREAVDDVSEESWDATLDLNLRTPFFLSRHLVPAMIDKGWGRIVNFASLQSFRAFPGGISYGASKGGVAQMTRAMAREWSPKGVNVNAIGPGFFPSEMTQAIFTDPERAARNAAQTCIGRNGEASDIDGPLLFLSSEMSAYVTGQILMVDGGFTAK